MADYTEDLEKLSPAKRALFELILKKAGQGPREATIPRRPDRSVAPLSFAQQRLWFLDQLEPQKAFYTIPAGVVALEGRLDRAALERSIGEIVRRHEILRTTFPTVDGRPTQRIAPTGPVAVPLVDVTHLPPDLREAEARRLAAEEMRRPFDLASGPLLRATLIRFGIERHLLVTPMHHIVSDGWSLRVFIKEFSTLYSAFAAGRQSPLSDLPIQYGDYAVWQRERLQGEALEHQLRYWRQKLGGNIGLLALPTDRRRPAVQSHRGAVERFDVTRRLTDSLKALARREGATLFMTLLAGFEVLLSRYAGQEDIVVGTPIAGRTRPELYDLIGFFTNTLVLRTDLSGSPTFREVLARVKQVCLEAYEHQDVPFQKLVEDLQPERSLGHAPLFQVMFVLQSAPPQPPAEMPGLTMHPVEVDEEGARFDLSLSFLEESGGLKGVLSYSTDLFDAATIRRMVGHLEVLLEGVAADPERALGELALMTGEELRQLDEWNRTGVEVPEPLCAHELFERQAARTPDAVAVAFEDERLTYAELDARSNQLARYLRRLGVERGHLVGVCLDRNLQTPVGVLGVLKAGAAYVPLDPTYPAERLALLHRDSGARVLLADETLPPAVRERAERIVYLDADWESIAGESAEAVVGPRPGAEDLAYVIYTSGSTGTPKGVMVEHRSLVNYLRWVDDCLFDEQVSAIPLVTSLSFDASLKQLFAPLLRGGEVWVLSREEATRPDALVEAIRRRSRVGLNCVPTLWASVLQAIEAGTVAAPAGSLTTLFVGGEPLSRDLVERSLAVLPDLRIWNLYGPTEATANASAGRVGSEGEVTIGRPVANTRIYIVDAHMRRVPVGVPGELCIGGLGVARGYLGRPDQTAERFVPDPFSREPGARMYRSGDLARYLTDGSIEYLGRTDDQVKLRGYRIEPGEIEAALCEHACVREAAVVLREAGDEKRLVAYVAGREVAPPAAAELREWLAERLPEYMVPSAFVALERLPLMPGGKVDRKALPAPERPETGAAYVAPRTPAEEVVAGIWAEVLGIERVGVDDNFFDLGGHSLLATQVVTRVREALAVELPLRALFGAPTVAGLSRVITSLRSDEAAPEVVARTIAGLRELSDEEALRLLESKRRARGDGPEPRPIPAGPTGVRIDG
jgi:amino acid adenylation domain-containing protein